MRKKLLQGNLFPRERKKNIFVSQTAKVLLLVVFIAAVFFVAGPVLAQGPDVGLEYAQETGLGTQDIRVTIARIIRVFLGFLGALAVLIILYGGFIWMTSGGEAEKVKQAKKILINAVIGLIIILSAFAIASFVLNYLLEATRAPRYPGETPYGAGGGALGGGIISSHYPERNAFDIPRNTSIVVTFKESMDLDSLIDFGDPNNPDDDLINRDSVRIRKTIDRQGPYVEEVRAFFTEDLKTFVFKPIEPLGSPEEAMSYTVELTENILKADKTSAFGLLGNYSWKFEVSTRIDNEPPQVTSVLPRYSNNPDRTVARNHIIQINFNEPVNPMAIGNIEINANGSAISGKFFHSNVYQTIEFETDDLCGKNTCGGDVYCLPANAFITVLVKAATLDSNGNVFRPYDGLVDMADNSLDGNYDKQAKGPVDDPYYLNLPPPNPAEYGDSLKWSFYTNDTIDLVPPEIVGYYPDAGQAEVSPQDNYEIIFNKYIMKSTITPGYEGYCGCNANNQCSSNFCNSIGGYCLDSNGVKYICTVDCSGAPACVPEREFIILVQPTEAEIIAVDPDGSKQYPLGGWAYWFRAIDNDAGQTTAILRHELLGEDLKFGLRVGSGIKDLLQNCYQPCAGPSCYKKAGDLPGEYEKGNPWEGPYPSCDLTNF